VASETPHQPAPARHQHRPAGPRRIRRAVRLVLLCTLLGVLALYVLARINGYQTLVVLSGSMGSTAPVGSLVVGRPLPADQVAVGDVVLLQNPGHTPVLHRVIERSEQDGAVVVRTKGDANPSPDPESHTLRGSTITPVLVIPGLGYALAVVRTTPGWIALILLPLVLTTITALRRRAHHKATPS